MKRKLIIILNIFCILLSSSNVFCETEIEYVDIGIFDFKTITNRSDQDRHVAVSKYYLRENPSKHAFCLEANKNFLPVSAKYTKRINNDDFLYKVVKAYEEIGKNDDNYYIATQLLIWKHIDDIDYTFDGNDYGSYKDEVLNHMNSNVLLSSSIEDLDGVTYESYIGVENTIKEDFTKYNIETEGIDIVSNDENGLTYKIDSYEPIFKQINFIPKNNDEQHSIVYESETSQNIYYFEEEYDDSSPFSINIKSLKSPQNFSLKFSKKDINGNDISGAKFNLFELNPNESNFELIFIQLNKEINIYEALLDNYLNYQNLQIKLSERYDRYLFGDNFRPSEVGYFPFKIYSNDILIKNGIAFVSNDVEQTNNNYSRIKVSDIINTYSGDTNIFDNLSTDKDYYLCETEPKKGYEYTNNPCTLIKGDEYNGETIEFINKDRKYTLKLMKHNQDNILLNGAKFKVSYLDGNENKDVLYTTGSLNVLREDNNKYLIYRKDGTINTNIFEFDSDVANIKNLEAGKYYYYQSYSNIVNNDLLNNDYQIVLKGGFKIDDLPYNSTLKIEELEAPNGYVITEPVFYITPDIDYSEITFTNYRINYIDIVPEKKFKIPRTCVED